MNKGEIKLSNTICLIDQLSISNMNKCISSDREEIKVVEKNNLENNRRELFESLSFGIKKVNNNPQEEKPAKEMVKDEELHPNPILTTE